MMNLGNYKDLSAKKIKADVMNSYVVSKEFMDQYEILVAWEEDGDYCQSSYFLLKNTAGNFFEVHGGHCSRYGFEGQFEPEECPIEYLLSDKQNLPMSEHKEVKRYIRSLAKNLTK